MTNKIGIVVTQGLQTIAIDPLAPPSAPAYDTATKRWTTHVTYDQTMVNAGGQNHTGQSIPGGLRFLMIKFESVKLPPGNSIEVDLKYGTDVFEGSNPPHLDVFTTDEGLVSGRYFWTRPIDIKRADPSGSGQIPIVITWDETSPVSFDVREIGRGESVECTQLPAPPETTRSNFWPFCTPAGNCSYVEPKYQQKRIANPSDPDWDNVQAILDPADARRTAAQSVGLLIWADDDESLCREDLAADDPQQVKHRYIKCCTVTCVDSESNVVLTAGHCLTESESASASIIFNYETKGSGAELESANAVFYKVTDMDEWADHALSIHYDYAFLRFAVPSGGSTVPAVKIKTDLPFDSEGVPLPTVFSIHHPNGAPKKAVPSDAATLSTFIGVSSSTEQFVTIAIDSADGSSGSPLFAEDGELIGVLSWAVPGEARFFPTRTVEKDLSEGLSQDPDDGDPRDIILVVDRSGSMMMSSSTPGETKMSRTQDALSAFLHLLRTDSAIDDKVALVSFNHQAPGPATFDHLLASFDSTQRQVLLGSNPGTIGGVVGALVPGGATSIGGALQQARLGFTNANQKRRYILLLTDGMQNTPPMIADAEAGLSSANIRVNAIGYGEESSLNGDLLTQLSQDHLGLYRRAGSGLALAKYFTLAFGQIFNQGTARDPDGILEAGVNVSSTTFQVCGEDMFTVVLGWESPADTLLMSLEDPSGKVFLTRATQGLEFAEGGAWTFLRVRKELGLVNDWDGDWKVHVYRQPNQAMPTPPDELFEMLMNGRIPGEGEELNYFVNVLATGGPKLQFYRPQPHYFTGDVFSPRLVLRTRDGSVPAGASIELFITRPDSSAGTLLSGEKIDARQLGESDDIPLRQAALQKLESDPGGRPIGYDETSVSLVRGFKSAGEFGDVADIFGIELPGVLTLEGNYTFRAVATFGVDCTAVRELVWTANVEVGIDPTATQMETLTVANDEAGTKMITVRVTPQDQEGVRLGPLRPDEIVLVDTPGNRLTEGPIDNLDGTYDFRFLWDPALSSSPGLMLRQPDRDLSISPPPDHVIAIRDVPGTSTGPGTVPETSWLLKLLLALVALIRWLVKLPRRDS